MTLSPSWPLLMWSVGLGLTSCALALQAIVTFPAAVASGALLVMALFPSGGSTPLRHHACGGAAASIAALVSYAWQLAWS